MKRKPSNITPPILHTLSVLHTPPVLHPSVVLQAPVVLHPDGLSRWETVKELVGVSRETWRQWCLAGKSPAKPPSKPAKSDEPPYPAKHDIGPLMHTPAGVAADKVPQKATPHTGSGPKRSGGRSALEKAKGRRESGLFVPLPVCVFESPNFRTLSSSALKLFMTLLGQLEMGKGGPRNNGNLCASHTVVKGSRPGERRAGLEH